MVSKKAKIIEKLFRVIEDYESKKKIAKVKHHLLTKNTFLIPNFLRLSAHVKLIKIDGHRCYIVTPKHATSKRCMYIHGGGFIMQITRPHWTFIHKLMLETNATIYVPDYPLSTNKYSGAKDSISLLLKIYKLMLDGCNSSNITIMGDSAGASLTLILGQQVKLHKLPAPKNLIALSPVLSLNIDESKSVEMGKHDSVLSAGLFYVAREWYVPRGANPKDPIYSPYYGDWKDIGLVTLFVGSHESLLVMANKWDKNLTKQKIIHNYIIGEDMFHVWPIFKLKESKKPLQLISNLIVGSKS